MLNTLSHALPNHEFLLASDPEHLPYGSRPASEIITLAINAIEPLTQVCDAIVIACNTATVCAIQTLRQAYPHVKFIGVEPMIKPASELTRTKAIAICATPTTLSSSKYNILKAKFANGIKVIEPDCGHWAELIENDRAGKIDLESLVANFAKSDVDVVALACTHYHVLQPRLQMLLPAAQILQPSDAIVKQVRAITDC